MTRMNSFDLAERKRGQQDYYEKYKADVFQHGSHPYLRFSQIVVFHLEI